MKDFTVNYNALKKQSKRGFTLIELVVVVAILAIIAAIAIPVFSNIFESTKKNTAIANARTIEYAIKEAQAFEAVGDDSLYKNIEITPIKIADVARVQEIEDAFEPIDYKGDTYTPAWSNDKVYFVNGFNTIDGQRLPSKIDISATADIAVRVL